MNITVEVPVKKYLVGFLNEEFGEDCKITARNPLARVLFSYLHVKYRKDRPLIFSNDHVMYKVIIPYQYFTRHGVSEISDKGMYELGDWFESYFNRMMKEYITSRLELKQKALINTILVSKQKKSLIQVQDSIQDFLKKYNISEEFMTTDALLKRYLRMKDKRRLLN